MPLILLSPVLSLLLLELRLSPRRKKPLRPRPNYLANSLKTAAEYTVTKIQRVYDDVVEIDHRAEANLKTPKNERNVSQLQGRVHLK